MNTGNMASDYAGDIDAEGDTDDEEFKNSRTGHQSITSESREFLQSTVLSPSKPVESPPVVRIANRKAKISPTQRGNESNPRGKDNQPPKKRAKKIAEKSYVGEEKARQERETAIARACLSAIRTQAYHDMRVNSSKQHINIDAYNLHSALYQQVTLLHDERGDFIFHSNTQLMIHNLVRQRNAARLLAHKIDLLNEGNDRDLQRAERAHKELSAELASEVDWQMSGNREAGLAEATEMVDELFGIALRNGENADLVGESI